MAISDSIPPKYCRKCDQEKPATTEFFYFYKGKPELPCKTCRLKKSTEYQPAYIQRPDVRVHRRIRQQNYRQRPEVQERNADYYQRPHVQERYRRYYADPDVAQRIRVRSKQYHTENAPAIRMRVRAYYVANRETLLDAEKRKRANETSEQRLTRNRRSNIRLLRRRARKRDLPDTLTPTQWQHALDYFNGCCAVCGRPPGLFHTLAADHWIPLSSPDCPGTVAMNMIPLCHGQSGCNNSKGDKPAQQWLEQGYGKRKARQILAHIEDFFVWVEQSD